MHFPLQHSILPSDIPHAGRAFLRAGQFLRRCMVFLLCKTAGTFLTTCLPLIAE